MPCLEAAPHAFLWFLPCSVWCVKIKTYFTCRWFESALSSAFLQWFISACTKTLFNHISVCS